MGQENLNSNQIDVKEKKKTMDGPDQIKINPVDITFYILLAIVIVCLIPYYEAIIEIFSTAAKAETGREIYYSMFALIVSIAVMISGFTMRNGVVKIFGLALTTLFAIYPMSGYFGNNSLFKKTLNDYDFVSLNIIKDTTCSGSQNFQKQLTEQLISQYGDDGFSIEVVTQPLDENASYKEKIKCMPTKTTMAYTLKYKDFYGVEREIIYINNDSFNDLLKVSSYEIIYDKIGEFLKNHQGKRKVSYKLYLLQNKKSLIDMNRNNVIEESVLMEYPATISLANYNLDKRIVLEIQMSDLSKRAEAHDLIDKLSDISNYPLNIIIKYGKNTEYFIQGKYYEINSHQEFIHLLSRKV